MSLEKRIRRAICTLSSFINRFRNLSTSSRSTFAAESVWWQQDSSHLCPHNWILEWCYRASDYWSRLSFFAHHKGLHRLRKPLWRRCSGVLVGRIFVGGRIPDGVSASSMVFDMTFDGSRISCLASIWLRQEWKGEMEKSREWIVNEGFELDWFS